MILGIDASNIRTGGGVTHLAELLRAADPARHGFDRVVVWSGREVLTRLEERPWLARRGDSLLDSGLAPRLFWQRFRAAGAVRDERIDVMFVPGTMHELDFHPLVVLSHNMLPFELAERARYGLSYMGIRLRLLERAHGKAYTSADGVLFLTRYARDTISARLAGKVRNSKIVPHGIAEAFRREPRPQEDISAYDERRPMKVLYVSIIDTYKHQTRLARAVARLHEEGLPLRLELVGPAYEPEAVRLRRVLREVDPGGEFVSWARAVPYGEIASVYHAADLFAFPSTCENLPNILIEAMASGLPIASSNRGPMPEVLEEGGMLFDPENLDATCDALRSLAGDAALRARLAARSFELAKRYDWATCAQGTLSYLASFGPGAGGR